MKVSQSIDILAPPERVWPYLVNPHDILKWCVTFRKCEYTSGRHSGVGASFHVEEKAGGPILNLEFAVTEWVENKALALVMTSGNFVKGYVQRWTIEPTDGGSRFSFMQDVRLPYGVVGKLVGFFGRSGSEAHVKAMLARLKTLAESSQADVSRSTVAP